MVMEAVMLATAALTAAVARRPLTTQQSCTRCGRWAAAAEEEEEEEEGEEEEEE